MDRLDQLPGRPPGRLTRQRADIVIFACGDPAHGEHDSIAIAACKGLPSDVLERVDLKLTAAMRPEYLRDLSAGTFVILADTVADTPDTPGHPGEILQLPFAELLGQELPLVTHSTPDQPLNEVLAMADLLRDEPVRGRFVGLGADHVDLRAKPDAEAVTALRVALQRVIDEVLAER